jgi:hypothetical protein
MIKKNEITSDTEIDINPPPPPPPPLPKIISVSPSNIALHHDNKNQKDEITDVNYHLVFQKE